MSACGRWSASSSNLNGLAIVASMPPGDPCIVLIRQNLENLLLAAQARVDCDDPFRLPSVRHAKENFDRRRPDVIFVGNADSAADIGPWCMPLPLASFGENVALKSRYTRTVAPMLRGTKSHHGTSRTMLSTAPPATRHGR